MGAANFRDNGQLTTAMRTRLGLRRTSPQVSEGLRSLESRAALPQLATGVRLRCARGCGADSPYGALQKRSGTVRKVCGKSRCIQHAFTIFILAEPENERAVWLTCRVAWRCSSFPGQGNGAAAGAVGRG